MSRFALSKRDTAPSQANLHRITQGGDALHAKFYTLHDAHLDEPAANDTTALDLRHPNRPTGGDMIQRLLHILNYLLL